MIIQKKVFIKKILFFNSISQYLQSKNYIMNFTDYREITYKNLQKEILSKAWADYLLKNGNEVTLANSLQMRTTQSVRNGFNQSNQVLSDELFNALLDILGVDGFVVWNKRKRKYFVKK